MEPKKILLVCAAGMSSSILVKKMKQIAKDLDYKVNIEAINITNIDYSMDYDLIMLAPQAASHFKNLCNKPELEKTKISLIDPLDYGMLNGEKILKKALELIDKGG